MTACLNCRNRVAIYFAIFFAFALVIPTNAAEPPSPNIVAWVMPDGSVKIDGEQFADANKLKEKLAAIWKKNPGADVHLRAQKNTRFETVGKAILLLQKAGWRKIGFITGPAELGNGPH